MARAELVQCCRCEDRALEVGGQDPGHGYGDFGLGNMPGDVALPAGLQGECWPDLDYLAGCRVRVLCSLPHAAVIMHQQEAPPQSLQQSVHDTEPARSRVQLLCPRVWPSSGP